MKVKPSILGRKFFQWKHKINDLYSKYKNSYNLIKRSNLFFKKWTNVSDRHFTKEDMQMVKNKWKDAKASLVLRGKQRHNEVTLLNIY